MVKLEKLQIEGGVGLMLVPLKVNNKNKMGFATGESKCRTWKLEPLQITHQTAFTTKVISQCGRKHELNAANSIDKIQFHT